MFEWLEKEISDIKTPRFHVVDVVVDQRFQEAVAQSNLPVPEAHKAFVLRVGNFTGSLEGVFGFCAE